MTTVKASLHWSRWILIGTIAFMGAALLLTVWITYSGVRGASDALVRGRAATLTADLREELRDIGQAPTSEDLQAIVESYGEDGLHYLAVVRHKTLLASGGHTSLAPKEVVRRSSSMKRNKLVTRGDRVQVILRGARARPRRRRNAPKARDLPTVFIEFEPKEAHALQASSTRSLASGAGAAILLWVTALFLLRWFARQDRERERQEEDRRLASLGEMSAVLAHEIRNPLASLKGNAQILETLVRREEPGGDAGPSKKLSKAERVVSEAIRLEELVNDLLHFARRGEISRTEVDPAALLRSCAEGIEPGKITVDSKNAPRSWSLDAARIQQVLNNLLQNAVQASELVEASVGGSSGKLHFVVRDHGAGILEGSEESLFEPFHTKKTQGTGLGLAVAKRLVELHGGTISATNAEGGGAEFRVEIPPG